MDTKVTPGFVLALGITVAVVGAWLRWCGLVGLATDLAIVLGAITAIIGVVVLTYNMPRRTR